MKTLRMVLLLGAALGAAGCRSDGFGRRDNASSLRYSTSAIARRTAEDLDATAGHLASLPRWVAGEFEDAPGEWRNTSTLYLEGRTSR